MRTVIELVAGFVVGVLGALWVRRRLCRHPFCWRRGTHWVAYYWPPVLGVVSWDFVNDRGDRETGARKYAGRDPQPSRCGPFCFTHATRECAHWTVEFGTHDWPVRPPYVAVEVMAANQGRGEQ